MADRQGLWSTSAPPPGYMPSPLDHRQLSPSPARPVYREPHPVKAGPVLSGLSAAAVWLILFGSLGRGLASYAWWTIAAAVSAWLVALLLAVVGDRGAAVGVAVASGLGLSIAMTFVGLRWADTYDWPLW
ncbi:hypothetical protein FB565_005390 [Actinoplanes lutulentus]|nr:hypothetical protein [Actinoplanes lutulentus]MBB2945632.1 hypothetical protein [Actinoplanes lutulentus]